VKLLLDSCTFVWLAGKPERLSEVAAAALDHAASLLHISHASLWEIALKYRAGKLHLPKPPREWWAEQIRRWRVVEISLTAEVLLRSTELPSHHKDPFDRVILAEAQMDGMTVVSPDALFSAYGVPLLW
jgi:PIN domain nuclease of toxin-antitoxin system